MQLAGRPAGVRRRAAGRMKSGSSWCAAGERLASSWRAAGAGKRLLCSLRAAGERLAQQQLVCGGEWLAGWQTGAQVCCWRVTDELLASGWRAVGGQLASGWGKQHAWQDAGVRLARSWRAAGLGYVPLIRRFSGYVPVRYHQGCYVDDT